MPYKFIFVDGEPTLVNVINSDEISHKCLVDTESQMVYIHKGHNINHIEADLEVLDYRLNNKELNIVEKTHLLEEKKILLDIYTARFTKR